MCVTGCCSRFLYLALRCISVCTGCLLPHNGSVFKRVLCHEATARPPVTGRGHGLQILKLAANVLNKQLGSAKKERFSSSSEGGFGEPQIFRYLLKNMDVQFGTSVARRLCRSRYRGEDERRRFRCLPQKRKLFYADFIK